MDFIESKNVTDTDVPEITYRVEVTADDDQEHPSTIDAFNDPATIAAWKNDEWLFVGVIVTPVIAGVGELDQLSADLWGVAYGQLPGIPNIGITEIIEQHPGPDLIAQVRASLARNLRPVAEKLTAVAVALEGSQ